MSSTMSLLGLFNWDSTIFDNMKVPDQVDKDILVKNLLSECAELEILYSNPDFLKFNIQFWSEKELAVWQRMANTFDLEYNPLYNVDATEYTKETRDLYGSESREGSGQEKGKNISSNTGSNSNTHKVAGYNSENTLTASESDEGSSSDNGTLNSDISRSDKEDINTTDKGDIITEHRRYGNIGVTKSTDLVRSEWELSSELNIYNYIIESFKQRFCLMVY